MYTTCVIWLAFVPLYFVTANHVPLRLTSMSVTISLSASVTVACLFSPKVSHFVFMPHNKLLFVEQRTFTDYGIEHEMRDRFHFLTIVFFNFFDSLVQFSIVSRRTFLWGSKIL